MSGSDDLVRRAQAGQAPALEALAREYLRPAYALALSVLQRPADAEDVAQDSLVHALQRIDTCQSPERFGAWLFQIVRNRAINALRRRRLRDVSRQPALGDEVATTDSSPDVQTVQRQLLAALGTLSEAQREVVLLHDMQGWTHAEIAQALGTSAVASRQRLHQARLRLREQLGDACITPEEPRD